MSRTRHQSKKGFDKCICGHYHPCPILDSLWDLYVQRQRKYRDRRHDVRHPVVDEE